MPNNAWPPEITRPFWSDGFEETAQDVTIRSPMDTGPVKVRRRFTVPQKSYKCTIVLDDAADYVTLSNFFYVTCKGGADTVLMPHPITGTPTVFRFAGPPTFRAVGIAWQADFVLESLP